MHSSSNLLPRIKLQELLNKQKKAALIFLSAPAGYGKSCLIKDWIETNQRKHEWLTFDSSSNNAELLLKQLKQALNQSPSIIVLDNYHWIESAEINDELEKLFSAIDNSITFILISRQLPPPSWSYLFAQENTLLLKSEELAFSKQEADLLLTHSPLQQSLSQEEWNSLRADYYYFLQGWPALTQIFFHLPLINERAKKYFIPTLPDSVIDFLTHERVHEIGREIDFCQTHPLFKFFSAHIQTQEKIKEQNYSGLLENLAYQQKWLSCIEILENHPIDFYAPEVEIVLDWMIPQISIKDLSAHPNLLNKLRLYYFSRQEEKYCALLFSKEFDFETQNNSVNSIESLFCQSIMYLKKGQLNEAQENTHELLSQAIRHQRTMPLLRGLILLSKICQSTNDYSSLIQALQFSSTSAFMEDSTLLRLSQLAIVPYHLAKGEFKEVQELLEDIRLCLDQETRLKTAVLEEEWAVCHAQWQQSQSLAIKEKMGNKAHVISHLSKREQEILQLIADGLSNEEIAERLQRSKGTIKLHAHHIYEKLEVKNRIEAVKLLRDYLSLKK